MADRKRQRLSAAAALILGAVLAGCGICHGGIVCEAKETGNAVTAKQEKSAAAAEEQEVIEFVTAYREALSPEKIDTLADYVNDPEDEDFQMDLLRNKAMFKQGVKGWESKEVIVCPMSDGKHWVVSASGDLLMDNLDFGIPGAVVLLVERNETGELKIVIGDATEFSDAFVEEMRELSLSDEIVDHNNEVAAAYNELIAEQPDLIELLESLNMAIDEEVRKVLAEQLTVKEKVDSEQQKLGAGKDSYTVKEGDCLWYISEEQLGDGMLWGGLYEKNRDVIGENPDLLYVGITLQL